MTRRKVVDRRAAVLVCVAVMMLLISFVYALLTAPTAALALLGREPWWRVLPPIAMSSCALVFGYLARIAKQLAYGEDL